MKTLGILGGMSDYASGFYLNMINQMINLEGRTADTVICAGAVWRIGKLAREGRWNDVAQEMIKAAREMHRAGADFVVIPSFSLHRVADMVAAESGVSILRMDDCIVETVAKLGCRKVAVLSSAEIADKEFMGVFYNRLVNSEGYKTRIFGTMATIEFSPITLANQPYSEGLRRKHLWTFLEEVVNVEESAEVIFNCSVEMTRMLGVRTVQEPIKTQNGMIPIIDAADLHVRAIVQACRGNP